MTKKDFASQFGHLKGMFVNTSNGVFRASDDQFTYVVVDKLDGTIKIMKTGFGVKPVVFTVRVANPHGLRSWLVK